MRRLVAILLTLAGAAAVCVGVGFVFWPAAVILAGLVVAAVGFFGVDVPASSR